MRLHKLFMYSLVILALVLSTARVHAATAEMKSADGKSVGSVVLIQTPHGVLIKADLKNIPAGGHGFHIHEKGTCSPDFKAAGMHYNPESKGHGMTQENGMHAGDMPNIYAAADGTVVAEVLNTNVTLESGKNSVFDEDGSTIIVHEKPDTHGADAGAGGRIACGVIQK